VIHDEIMSVLTDEYMTTARVNQLWRASKGDYGEPHGTAATVTALRRLQESGLVVAGVNASGARVWKKVTL
jgi:hypothetical protein